MPYGPQPNRRTLLKSVVIVGALPIVGFTGRPLPRNPFTLGVASGDPAPDGVVLWTRLAVDPLAGDGRGGMPARPVEVQWELSADESFRHVERRGTAVALPEAAHSVHVEPAGLHPAADYFYRFRTEGHLSPTGRTRTAAAAGSLAPMTVCVASCSHYEQGWFTAYRRLAEEEPDLVVHLGDYHYEYAAAAGGPARVRDHVGPETVTLANYRQRYAQYKTDPDLQAAHAAAPWLVVFDDHEIANNWAADVPAIPDVFFGQRRAAALQAYYENMPLRTASAPHGTAIQLFRRVHWGDLATFHLLDTRQYRTDQPCDDRFRAECPQRFDPAATLTGTAQERWLLDGFATSRARWDILGQQVFFGGVDLTPGPGHGVNPDGWDGYVANRDRIIAGLAASPVRNAVVLTGDIHSHWAATVHASPGDTSTPTVATELVTSSISSGGDGSDTRADVEAILPDNPHIRYFSNRRGYLRSRITAEGVRADFRTVPYVSTPGAPARTDASFAIADRQPALHAL